MENELLNILNRLTAMSKNFQDFKNKLEEIQESVNNCLSGIGSDISLINSFLEKHTSSGFNDKSNYVPRIDGQSSQYRFSRYGNSSEQSDNYTLRSVYQGGPLALNIRIVIDDYNDALVNHNSEIFIHKYDPVYYSLSSDSDTEVLLSSDKTGLFWALGGKNNFLVFPHLSISLDEINLPSLYRVFNCGTKIPNATTLHLDKPATCVQFNGFIKLIQKGEITLT